MESSERPRNSSSSSGHPSFTFHTSNHYPVDPPRVALPPDVVNDDKPDPSVAFMKGPKRKRLAKACDACHKSKRRCDGTAPCSNCYFASKSCTYTDSSGRPVPAPRPFKTDTRTDAPLSTDHRPQPSYSTQFTEGQSRFTASQSHHMPNGFPSSANAVAAALSDHSEDERINSRKRFRNGKGNPIASEDIPMDPILAQNLAPPVELDHALTRELTNLFFTHCHPARAIIHKPNFSADLSHNRVPCYLLHAVCALAAPLSKQPRIRTTPRRFAGKPFAQEALKLMFDVGGRLVCEPNLATAQALCLLQIHDYLAKEQSLSWNSRYHDLALQIVESLGVHNPEHPTLTPVPSPEFILAATERESVRRIFWLIHLIDVMASIYCKKPMTFSEDELRLRLPVDETSFELAVHSTLPEYLYLPAVRTQYASENGHLIRVISIYAKVELALDALDDSELSSNPAAALLDAEQSMDAWAASLPEHLRFSEQSLQVQQSMFETSSNNGAWCYCCMHVFHASCALALNVARQRAQRGPKSEPQWALSMLDMILNMLGDRAKNSLLMGAALWSLIKYCKRDDAQIHTWCADYEDFWGVRVQDIPFLHPSSPPQQHQQYSSPQHSQPQRRRLSEVRHPGTSPIPIPRPPAHQHGGDVSYNGRRRSPSSSPSAYPLGRSLDDLRLHSNRGSHQHVTDRDVRGGGSGPGVVGSGPGSGLVGMGQHEREQENGISGSGSGSGGGSVNGIGVGGGGGQRGHGINIGDGPQSLPSLKASGLLDSWNLTHSREAQKGHGNGTLQRSPPRRSPPSAGYGNQETDVRSATLGMPVGLQWLANESR